MSTTLAPFGLRPAFHPSGIIRPREYKLVDATQAAYASAIYTGSPVALVTDGSIALAAAGADWLGVFQGCSYKDTTGKPVVSPYWPASNTGATDVKFFILDDPAIVYEVQCGAAVANTAIGDQLTTFDATYTVGSGNATTGLSTAAFSGTLAGAGSQGMARVLGLAKYENNAWGDTYTIVQVQNARHQYVAVKTAI